MPSSERPPRRHGEPSPPPEIPPVPVDSPGRRDADGPESGGEAGAGTSRKHTEPGATFLLLASVHGAFLLAGTACLVALAAGVRDAATLYLVGGYGSLFATAGLAGLLSRRGVPRAIHPDALYPRRGWALVAIPPLAFALGYLAAASVTDPTPGGAALAAVLGGLAAFPGLVLVFVSRNAVARALRESTSHEWTGPRSRGRIRRLWLLGIALGAVLVVASVVSFLRGGPQLLGLLGVVVVLVGTAHEDLTVAVTPGGLVISKGTGDYYRIVRWSTVAGVERRDGALVVARRGPRPSLRFDASAVEDPAAVVAAARRHLHLSG